MPPFLKEAKPSERKRKSKVQSAEQNRPTKKIKNGHGNTPTYKKADAEGSAGVPSTRSEIVNGRNGAKRQASSLDSTLQAASTLAAEPVGKKDKSRRKSKDSRSLSPGHGSTKGSLDTTSVGSKIAMINPAPKSPQVASIWQLSQPVGGRFIHLDPCFSKDERHVLLATRRNVLVYSISNSLLHCKIPVSVSDPIVALSISEANPNLAFVATADGTVTLLDWFAGRQLYSVNYGCQIVTLVPVAVEDTAADVLYLIVKSSNGSVSQSHVASVTFAHDEISEQQPTLDQLSSTSDSLRHLQVLNGGRVVFAASRTTVLLGWSPIRRGKAYAEQDESLKHMWKTVDFSEGLTCIHARYFASVVPESDNDRKNTAKGNKFSLAIGSESGAIYLYENILDVFRAHETSLMKPRRLHWHRNPVGALKWSLDGNYLISGGRETVLLIWQLDTSRRQDLPHLTAGVEGLTVSPSGTSYAVHLADNSVMVLSTTELAPKAIMSGLQSKCYDERSITPTWDLNYLQTSVAESPFSPDQLLLAVPASTSSSFPKTSRSAPFLQTFDLAQSRSVSRQALTRNNAVNINKAPAGHAIREANVQKIAVSSDGLWLASIEEWSPPPVDIKDTAGMINADEVRQERHRRRETYLKFWKFDTAKQQWSLHARIDAPHQVDWEPESSKIIALVHIPGDPGFATIGEDSIVRLWTPKTRLKDGRIRRGVHAEGQTTWSCSLMLNIERINVDSDLIEDEGIYEACKRASIAISADGTTLAVSIDSTSGVVHIFDASTGEAQLSVAGMYSKDLVDMQFLGKHLVILADDIYVWDITTNQLVLHHGLYQQSDRFNSEIKLLAVDEATGSFAVCRTVLLDGNLGSRIEVFDTSSSHQPIYQADEPIIVTALKTSKATSSFILLTAEAETYTLQSPSSQPILRTIITQATTQPRPELALDADTINNDSTADNNTSTDRLLLTADASDGDNDDNDADMQRTFVRGNQLAQLFEGMSSHALPPVQDMFHAVARLYIGKNKV